MRTAMIRVWGASLTCCSTPCGLSPLPALRVPRCACRMGYIWISSIQEELIYPELLLERYRRSGLGRCGVSVRYLPGRPPGSAGNSRTAPRHSWVRRTDTNAAPLTAGQKFHLGFKTASGLSRVELCRQQGLSLAVGMPKTGRWRAVSASSTPTDYLVGSGCSRLRQTVRYVA